MMMGMMGSSLQIGLLARCFDCGELERGGLPGFDANRSYALRQLEESDSIINTHWQIGGGFFGRLGNNGSGMDT